jgi:hypothetical protein
MNDNQTNKFKTLTIGTRVTAAQKKLYKETAERLGLGFSEYLADLMQMYYNAYESYGKPTALEIALEQENRALKLELKNIKRDQQNDYECAQLFMKDRDKMSIELKMQKSITAIQKVQIEEQTQTIESLKQRIEALNAELLEKNRSFSFF